VFGTSLFESFQCDTENIYLDALASRGDALIHIYEETPDSLFWKLYKCNCTLFYRQIDRSGFHSPTSRVHNILSKEVELRYYPRLLGAPDIVNTQQPGSFHSQMHKFVGWQPHGFMAMPQPSPLETGLATQPAASTYTTTQDLAANSAPELWGTDYKNVYVTNLPISTTKEALYEELIRWGVPVALPDQIKLSTAPRGTATIEIDFNYLAEYSVERIDKKDFKRAVLQARLSRVVEAVEAVEAAEAAEAVPGPPLIVQSYYPPR
jgi:hypothetical protein